MPLLLNRFLLLFAVLLFSNNCTAEEKTSFSLDPAIHPHPTAIWKIENPATGQHFYLGGTTHSLLTTDLPLPSPYYGIYEVADVLVFEILREAQEVDHAALRGWVARNKQHLKFPRGQSLEDHLSLQTKGLLRTTYGARYRSKIAKTPLRLAFEAMREQSDRTGGIEDLFRTRGKQDHKPMMRLEDSSGGNLALETLESLSRAVQAQIANEGIDATVRSLLVTPPQESVFLLYRDGDLEAMNAELVRKRQLVGEEAFKNSLSKRNQKWTAKLLPMLQTNSPEVEFVLVGAAHLAGDSGLLSLLQQSGCKARQIYGIDPLKATAP